MCDKGGMAVPKPKELSEAVGISPSYASMILSGERKAPPSLAAEIYRKLQFKTGIFCGLNDADAEVAARIHSKAA